MFTSVSKMAKLHRNLLEIFLYGKKTIKTKKKILQTEKVHDKKVKKQFSVGEKKISRDHFLQLQIII